MTDVARLDQCAAGMRDSLDAVGADIRDPLVREALKIMLVLLLETLRHNDANGGHAFAATLFTLLEQTRA